MAIVAAGCAGTIRPASREATQGGIEALRESHDPLVRDTRKLLELYASRALERSPGEIAQEGGRLFAQGALKALGEQLEQAKQEELAQLRAAIRLAGADMARGLVEGLRSRQHEINAFAAAMVEGVTARMMRDGNSNASANGGPEPAGDAPLLQRAGAAFVKGATTELAGSFDQCGDPQHPCPQELIRRASRTAAIGTTEGIARPWLTWPIGLAFVFGAVVILAVDGARRLIRRRRSAQTAEQT